MPNDTSSSNPYKLLVKFILFLFDYIPYQLDRKIRRVDRFLFRTDFSNFALTGTIKPPGHALGLYFLTLSLFYFTIAGPTYHMFFSWQYLPYLFLFSALITVTAGQRLLPSSVYFIHLTTALLVAIIIFILDPKAKESDSRIYLHAYILLGPASIVIPLLGSLYVKYLFKDLDTDDVKGRLSECFSQVELFEARDGLATSNEYRKICSKLGNAFILASLYNPLLLLLLPSIVVLFTQERHDLLHNFYFGLSISFLLLVYGRLRQRWHIMMQLIEQSTMKGVPLAISIFVIISALGRLANFSYISIFLDGTRLTVWGYLLAFYIFAWTFEYWINRFLNEYLLTLFNSNVIRGDSSFEYYFKGPNILGISELELKRERIFQVHGGSRYMIQSRDKKWFHSFTRIELLERLLTETSNQQELIDNKRIFNSFRSKFRIYFSILNFILIATATMFLFTQFNMPIEPIYEGQASFESPSDRLCSELPDTEEGFRLDCSLLRLGEHGNEALLIAASGGGTRAALHTTSVLYGLKQQNLLDNIVLASGVSGGGVALAYLAHNYHDLAISTQTDDCFESDNQTSYNDLNFPNSESWRCFFEAMSHPYIKDVVEGMAELRILRSTSNGQLLVESLNSQFVRNGQAKSLAELENFALLLNTTITGHRYHESKELREQYRQVPINDQLGHYFKVFQGGRIALTNLDGAGQLTSLTYLDGQDQGLKYRAFNFNSMPVTVAAAMTANFPPVFSDALLCTTDTCDHPIHDRSVDYLITDGGAMHNQGLISLLLAAKLAIARLPECPKVGAITLPRMHVIHAEASFANLDYSGIQRGTGAALASSYGLGHGVAAQIYKEANTDYNRKHIECNGTAPPNNKSIIIHEIPLPKLFRSRGGMGTHWMMPKNIIVTDPRDIDKDTAKRFELSRDQLKQYFVSAYSHCEPYCKASATNNTICTAITLPPDSLNEPSRNMADSPWESFLNELGRSPNCFQTSKGS